MTDDAREQRRQAVTVARRRKRLRAFLFMAMLVLAGVVIGAGGAVVFFKHRMFRRPPPRPAEMTESIMARLENVLPLAPDESERLRHMVGRCMDDVERIRKESFEEIHERFEASNNELRTIIGDERYRQWEDYKDKHLGDKRRKRGKKSHH